MDAFKMLYSRSPHPAKAGKRGDSKEKGHAEFPKVAKLVEYAEEVRRETEGSRVLGRSDSPGWALRGR
jgi:hypothetical protein